MKSITRRTFAKAGALGAAGAIAAGAFTSRYFDEADVAWADEGAEQGKDEWKPAYCVGCHVPICATKVRVKDGVAVEIKGDPKSPVNQGHLCPRGLSVVGSLYHPYRVKVPLKRTNPEKSLDNDPGWAEIGWDEALDTCTQKLKECKEKDPRGLFTMSGFGNEDSFKKLIFEAPFGTPNGGSTSGPLCADHFGPQSSKNSKVDIIDLEHCKYVLLIGRSMGDEWAIASTSSKYYVDAVKRGLKVVCVNPQKTNSAQTGEWVPIKTGTDTALLYAILHTMMHEIGQYDDHFLKVRTNAPYLIEDAPEDHSGTKVSFADYARDAASDKPLVWDESLGHAVPFDSSVGDTYALFGTYEVDGRTVKPSMQLIKEYIADMTPEWAEEICGVPADTTRKIANDLVENACIGQTIKIDGETFPYRPSLVMAPGRGANSNPLNVELFKAAEIINNILGNSDVPGGALTTNPPDQQVMNTDADGMLVPLSSDMFYSQTMGKKELEFPPNSYSLDCFYPHELHVVQLVWKAMLDPKSYHLDYEPQVFFTLGGANQFRSNGDPETVVEAMKKIPFVFSISHWFDEPTQFADVVLPEHNVLERYEAARPEFTSSRSATDYSRGLRVFLARKPVVEPVYDTRQNEDLLIEFARRLGILPAMLGIANNAYQGAFQPKSRPGLGQYAIDIPSAMQNKDFSYKDIVEAKIRKEFNGAGWELFEDCSTQSYKIPSTAATYVWHYYPENAYRIPVYFQRNGKSAKQLKALLESNNIEFPHANFDDVLRQYSCLPAFFEFDEMQPKEEYPLKVFQFKTHFQVNDSTGLSYNQWLHDIEEHYEKDLKKIVVAPSAAEKMGLKSGDEVVVESMYGGKTKGVLKTSELVHPETLGISGKWGARGSGLIDFAREGAHYNSLVNGDERDIGFMMGNLNNSLPVKVYKA